MNGCKNLLDCLCLYRKEKAPQLEKDYGFESVYYLIGQIDDIEEAKNEVEKIAYRVNSSVEVLKTYQKIYAGGKLFKTNLQTIKLNLNHKNALLDSKVANLPAIQKNKSLLRSYLTIKKSIEEGLKLIDSLS